VGVKGCHASRYEAAELDQGAENLRCPVLLLSTDLLIIRIRKEVYRRKIRLIESNAKCRYIKNRPVQGHCGQCLSV
jgi:hypothetical protein